MKKSLQAIQDYYERKGLRGAKLKKVLLRDREYQTILLERKHKLKKQFKVSKQEAERYILSTDRDYEILKLFKTLEKKKLVSQDRAMINLLRTQLEHDWRKPLIIFLRRMLKKYGK